MPSEIASRSASAAWGGPIVSTAVLPPCFSFRRSASSMAYTSKGLMIEATPSRTRVLVSGLIRTFVVSGTCLMQTTIFTPPALLLPPDRFLDQVHRDHLALDLVGALVDLGDLRVAHHLFDRVLLHVAVAAEHLHRVRG